MKPGRGRAAPQASTDMTGPSWLAITFAAIVILAGAYSASRLAISRLRRRATEFDADALHAVMGAAMAGMLVPPHRESTYAECGPQHKAAWCAPILLPHYPARAELIYLAGVNAYRPGVPAIP